MLVKQSLYIFFDLFMHFIVAYSLVLIYFDQPCSANTQMCLCECIANENIKKTARCSIPCFEILELFTKTYTMHHKTASKTIVHKSTIKKKKTLPIYIYYFLFGIWHPNHLFWYRKNILNYMEALKIKIIIMGLFLTASVDVCEVEEITCKPLVWLHCVNTGAFPLCFQRLMHTLKACCVFYFELLCSGTWVVYRLVWSMHVWMGSWGKREFRVRSLRAWNRWVVTCYCIP